MINGKLISSIFYIGLGRQETLSSAHSKLKAAVAAEAAADAVSLESKLSSTVQCHLS